MDGCTLQEKPPRITVAICNPSALKIRAKYPLARWSQLVTAGLFALDEASHTVAAKCMLRAVRGDLPEVET